METFEEIIRKIAQQTGKTDQDILLRVREKQRELSNLISEEGAAYIIAKESGIELIKKKDYELKICNIISGMKNVVVIGRILSTDDIRLFKTDKAEGKVASLRVGDDTGTIRLILWNDQTDKIKDFKRDNLIKITGAFAKDNMGRVEISLGKMGKTEKIQDSAEMPYADEIEAKFSSVQNVQTRSYNEETISDLKEGENARIRACIAQLFESSPFFFMCPECKIKVDGICKVHNKREPNLIISGIVDDGTANIRAVFFRNAAEKLIGLSTSDAWALFEPVRNPLDIYSRIKQGKDYIFKGYVKKNKLFERLEFVVSEVEEVDVKAEIAKIMSK